jgi:hypothetical protein
LQSPILSIPVASKDDVGKSMIGELRNRGVKTEAKPGQQDFGLYFNFEVAGAAEHTFVIGYRPTT